MLDRKILLTTVLAVCMAVSMSAQENKKSGTADAPKEGEAAKPSGPPAGLQWANRDMTYHGQGYDLMDSTYYPNFLQ